MKNLADLFASLKTAYDARPRHDRELVCKSGFYSGCPVLKLQKAGWTNDDMRFVPNLTGVFFSIWVDDEAVKQNRIKYNIHALKLRQLAGYQLTSRAFANEFRDRFKPQQESWPNVSVDYGPQTLMQGWIERSERTINRDLLNLMDRFGEVSPIIDELLKMGKDIVAVQILS